MYRVLLIDDENIIVEGLRRVIRWADYNCQVVGTAYVPFRPSRQLSISYHWNRWRHRYPQNDT